jgi:hypothetical protein
MSYIEKVASIEWNKAALAPVKQAISVDTPSKWDIPLQPLSQTVGRVLGAPTGIISGVPSKVFRRWSKDDRVERFEDMAELYEDLYGMEDRGHLALGKNPFFKQLGRIWSRDDLSLFNRLMGTVGLPATKLVTDIIRMDHYNPTSDTAVVYDPVDAIGAHEMGHMTDAARRGLSRLGMMYGYRYPFVPLPFEYKASVLAETAKEISKAKKDKIFKDKKFGRPLRRGIGSYIGRPFRATVPASAILGAFGADALGVPFKGTTRLLGLRGDISKNLRSDYKKATGKEPENGKSVVKWFKGLKKKKQHELLAKAVKKSVMKNEEKKRRKGILRKLVGL